MVEAAAWSEPGLVATLAPPKHGRREADMPPLWRVIEIDDVLFESRSASHHPASSMFSKSDGDTGWSRARMLSAFSPNRNPRRGSAESRRVSTGTAAVEAMAEHMDAKRRAAFAQLMPVIEQHRAMIRVAFRFYCVYEASNDPDADPESMNKASFLAFAKGMSLNNKGLAQTQLERLFTTSARPDPKAERRGADARKSAFANAQQKAANLDQPAFVAALVRIAVALKLAISPDAGDQLDRFCVELLGPHVSLDLGLLGDDLVGNLMAGRAIHAVKRKHALALREVFEDYAARDQSNESALDSLDTMNTFELAALCTDCQLLDAKFGLREMVMAFVRINVDNEVYELPAGTEDSLAELELDDFVEVVVRIYVGRFWDEETALNSLDPLEQALDKWLEMELLPAAAAAMSEYHGEKPPRAGSPPAGCSKSPGGTSMPLSSYSHRNLFSPSLSGYGVSG